MSGNIRLESQFTRIGSQQVPITTALLNPAPTVREVDGQVGNLSSNLAESIGTGAAINRLDALIDDFKKGEDRLDER